MEYYTSNAFYIPEQWVKNGKLCNHLEKKYLHFVRQKACGLFTIFWPTMKYRNINPTYLHLILNVVLHNFYLLYTHIIHICVILLLSKNTDLWVMFLPYKYIYVNPKNNNNLDKIILKLKLYFEILYSTYT